MSTERLNNRPKGYTAHAGGDRSTPRHVCRLTCTCPSRPFSPSHDPGEGFQQAGPSFAAILHLSRPSHVIPEAGLTWIPSGPGQLPVKREQMSALRRPIRANAHACSSHRWLLLTQASGFSVTPEAEAS